MNIELLIRTLRAMNEDGVNCVGYAADVIEAQQKKLAEMKELLDEAYADADEVLRPRVAYLERQLADCQARVGDK
jgi:hypothetical protein